MNYLSDIITYVRRIIKSPSNATITDALIIDYINRFWLMDMDARMQLFDLKTIYKFDTVPGIDQYNMPLYTVQTEPGSQNIAPFPVYQGFIAPCFVNGIQVPYYIQRESYFNQWPNYTQALNPAATGNGTAGPYYIPLPFFPALPGHVDITGIIAYINSGNSYKDPILIPSGSNATMVELLQNIPTTSFYPGVYFTATAANGQNIVVQDTGIFLEDNTDSNLYGILVTPGNAPYGNTALGTGSPGDYTVTSNTVNYTAGYANVTFSKSIPAGAPINAQCFFYEQGLPRSVLFYNNVITIRPSPNTQYTIELGTYLTPAAFLNSANAIPFGYMAEYISRGAARKILSDTGDIEQFQFYEPLFREQENLVWKRSQRILTSTRTGTIFSELYSQSPSNNYGNGT